jgi:PAS domain S-box-containing protein
VNDGFLSLTGYRHDEVIGNTTIGLHLWNREEDRIAVVRELSRNRTVHGAEFQFRKKSGDLVTGLFSADIIAIDKQLWVLSSISDITARKRAEDEVHRLNDVLERRVRERTAELETINTELASFSYSISHDLRGPLRGIDGFSQALLEDNKETLDGKSQDYLRRVREAAQHMGHLIDDLLKIARISKSEIQHKSVDLSAEARGVFESLQEQYPERSVEATVQEGLLAGRDARLIRILMEHLLGNAWKFTMREEKPRIEFGSFIKEGETIYFVRDNGVGFDMAYIGKLFGTFQRLHTLDDFPGTGVGLATVQRIINRHGGRIWAEGEVGKGATFYFTLS